jgi:hypothetical protein
VRASKRRRHLPRASPRGRRDGLVRAPHAEHRATLRCVSSTHAFAREPTRESHRNTKAPSGRAPVPGASAQTRPRRAGARAGQARRRPCTRCQSHAQAGRDVITYTCGSGAVVVRRKHRPASMARAARWSLKAHAAQGMSPSTRWGQQARFSFSARARTARCISRHPARSASRG